MGNLLLKVNKINKAEIKNILAGDIKIKIIGLSYLIFSVTRNGFIGDKNGLIISKGLITIELINFEVI